MSDLPKQVQEASDLADKMQQEAAVVREDTAIPMPVSQDTTAQPVQQQQIEPVQEDNEVQKLRSKYSTLQGKYNSEVPELSRKLHDKDALIKQLQEENQALQAKAAEAEQKQAYLTDDDVEEFGEGTIDMVRRGAKEGTAPLARRQDGLEQRLANLEAQRQADVEANRERTKAEFAAYMDKACPDWRVQDTDQGFNAWLDETDPQLGILRRTVLQMAASRSDAAQVALIFNAYNAEKQGQQSTLRTQVTPNHSRNSVAPQGTQPRVWTTAMVKAAYDAMVRKQYTPEQEAQIMKEIDEAAWKGQIKP